MADYFVSPRDYTDLRIESGQLADAMRQQWPDIRFVYRDDIANRLQWALSASSGREIWGEMQPNGQAVVLNGDIFDAAEFARWLRGQVPDRYELIFYDEGFSHDVPLTESTSVDELTRPFLVH